MEDKLKLFIKNGVHFGHQTSRWNPKMAPYIWGSKNGIHLIDVSKTLYQLDAACKFLESLAAQGKTILWVGTKKAAQDTILNAGKSLNSPYVVHRWVGGSFSNYRQVRKSVQNLLHMEDIIAKSAELHYGKKELNTIQKRIERLVKNVGGIRNLGWPVGAVVVVDVKKEHVCVKEALTMGIPVVALVDTNSDPSGIDYVIPANDDVPRSINVLIDFLTDAVKRGQAVAASKPKEEVQDVSFEFPSEGHVPGLEEEEEDQNKKRRSGTGAGAAQAKNKKPGQQRHSPRAPKRADEEDAEVKAKKNNNRKSEEPSKAVAE